MKKNKKNSLKKFSKEKLNERILFLKNKIVGLRSIGINSTKNYKLIKTHKKEIKYILQIMNEL